VQGEQKGAETSVVLWYLSLMKTLPRREEDATTDLLKSPRNAERLKTAIAEPTSSHRVFETLEDLEDALGI
jgi:hypothetical protein